MATRRIKTTKSVGKLDNAVQRALRRMYKQRKDAAYFQTKSSAYRDFGDTSTANILAKRASDIDANAEASGRMAMRLNGASIRLEARGRQVSQASKASNVK